MTSEAGNIAPPPMITLKEAARQLSVSVPTVYRFVKTGQLPCVKVGGRLRLRPSEFENWIKTNAFVVERETRKEKNSLKNARSILDWEDGEDQNTQET
jgi:excisionase family DNA binding protein